MAVVQAAAWASHGHGVAKKADRGALASEPAAVLPVVMAKV
jgi:hypothetical protein